MENRSTLSTDNLADNAPEIISMHWKLIWWRTGAHFLRCYRLVAQTPQSAKGDVFGEGVVWWMWGFVGMKVFPCQRDWVEHAEVLTPLSRLVNWFTGLAAHAPNYTKLMRTAPDEQTGSWWSPDTEGWSWWWEWCQYSEDKRRSGDPTNALGFSS